MMPSSSFLATFLLRNHHVPQQATIDLIKEEVFQNIKVTNSKGCFTMTYRILKTGDSNI